ncbi:MAG: ATP-binding protein [Gemmatimonadaceae bacterium]
MASTWPEPHPALGETLASESSGDRGVGYDELTGLPLRRAAAEYATRALREDLGADRPLGLIVVDVDNFKLINDIHGHLCGDDALRVISAALGESIECEHLLARYAGDEFLAVLPNADLDACRVVAERLREEVTQRAFRVRAGPRVELSLSVGVACAPAHGNTFDALFASADRALYEAKRQGRNRVVCYTGVAPRSAAVLDTHAFVGRGPERQRVTQVIDAGLTSGLTVCSIIGEAGIGKSTFARRLMPEIRMRGALLVTGACHESDVRPAYGPWIDVLRSIVHANITVPGDWRELGKLVPSLGAPAPRGRTRRDKYALYEELVEFLQGAAAQRPIVALIDDMQWADHESWHALEYVTSQLARQPLVLCLTIRAEDAGPVRQYRERLARFPGYHELELARLSLEEVRRLLPRALPGLSDADELVRAVFRQTEGNPFLIVQTLRMLIEDGRLWFTGTRWAWASLADLQLPATSRNILVRRISRLSASARAVLAAAAVIGQEFDLDLLIEASDRDEDAVLRALEEAVESAVVSRITGPDGERFAFSHGLLGDTLRESLLERRLMRLHRRISAAIERRDPNDAAAIAAHAAAARDHPRAHAHALRAGDGDLRIYAHDNAAAHFALAIRHAGSSAERRAAQLRRLVALDRAGQYDDAATLCAAILEDLAQDCDPELRIRIEREHARFRLLLGASAESIIEACRTLLPRAVTLQRQTERARTLELISQCHSKLGAWRDAESAACEFVRIAEVTEDAQLVADASLRLGTALLQIDVAQATTIYREALARFEALGDDLGVVRAHINLGVALSRQTEHHDAVQSLRAAEHLAQERRLTEASGLAAMNLGATYARLGRYEESKECLARALVRFTRVRNESYRVAASYNLAHALFHLAAYHEAADEYAAVAHAARSVGLPDVVYGATAGQGLTLRALGRAEEGDRAMSALAGTVARDDWWWFHGRELVDAFTILRCIDRHDAARASELLLEHAARIARYDEYAALWLVAQCVPTFRVNGSVPREVAGLTIAYREIAVRRSLPHLVTQLTGIVN